MEQLWAPWRSKYIQQFSENTENNTQGCFFCEAGVSADMEKHLVVYKGKNLFVILNRYPYNTGHIMITPYRHTHQFEFLDEAEATEMIFLQQVSTSVLNEVYKPNGINIGANLGESAGAGVPGHIHFHLVPRWNGDTNFMPVIAGTKVISESLEETWKKLRDRFLHIT